MTVKVEIKSKIKQKTDKAVDLYDQKTAIYLNKVANMYRNYIVIGMQQTAKGGRIYGKRKHEASLPDNPPAIDTGRLVSSISLHRAMPYMAKKEATVFTDVKYANILEQSFAKGGLQRYFMGKESRAFKQAEQYANAKYKDISIGKTKII